MLAHIHLSDGSRINISSGQNIQEVKQILTYSDARVLGIKISNLSSKISKKTLQRLALILYKRYL